MDTEKIPKIHTRLVPLNIMQWYMADIVKYEDTNMTDTLDTHTHSWGAVSIFISGVISNKQTNNTIFL